MYAPTSRRHTHGINIHRRRHSAVRARSLPSACVCVCVRERIVQLRRPVWVFAERALQCVLSHNINYVREHLVKMRARARTHSRIQLMRACKRARQSRHIAVRCERARALARTGRNVVRADPLSRKFVLHIFRLCCAAALRIRRRRR